MYNIIYLLFKVPVPPEGIVLQSLQAPSLVLFLFSLLLLPSPLVLRPLLSLLHLLQKLLFKWKQVGDAGVLLQS